MNIKKIENIKDVIILEYCLENGKRDQLIFSKKDKYELKNKVKQFKKTGSITLTIVDNNKVNILNLPLKWIKIHKILEMYTKTEDEQSN